MNTTTTLLKWISMSVLVFLTTTLLATNDEYCESNEDAFSLYCPDDVTVSCDAELWDLSVYGNATYHDYTGWHSAGYPYEHWNLNSCGTGTITRTWTVEDYNWNIHTCTQTIYVGSNGGFGYYHINWPNAHVELEGCNPSTHPSDLDPEDGWPNYAYAECSNVGVSYSDKVFIVNDACKKIRRTWTVMDWCQVSYGGWGYSSGVWTFEQIIKISGGDAPEVTCVEEVEAGSYNCKDAYVNVPLVEVYGGEACGGDFTIRNHSPYADSYGADASGIYPIGKTTVKYTVEYGCGKKKHCTTEVVVKDKKGPTVYCFGELTVALMGIDEDGDGVPEDGMVEIWAKDLDRGSTPNCNGHSIHFSFDEAGQEMNKVFTCADLGANEVRMYVTDNYGRQSYCVVTVNVQNNGANIPDCVRQNDDDDDDDDDDTVGGDSTYFQLLTVSGSLTDQFERPMEGAEFSLKDRFPTVTYNTYIDTTLEEVRDSFINQSGVLLYFSTIDTVFTEVTDSTVEYGQHTAFSDKEGFFSFTEVADSSSSYILSAKYKTEESYKGVNKLDLDFLLEVLVGDTKFESVAQRIAADINMDGKVNFDDLKILLKHVSEEEKIDAILYDWRVMPAVKSEEDIEEIVKNITSKIDVEIKREDKTDIRFHAIKIGDLIEKEVSGFTQYDNTRSKAAAVLEAVANGTTQEIFSRSENFDGKHITPSVSVAPNPMRDQFTVSYTDDLSGIAQFQLIDIKGQVLSSETWHTTVGTNEKIISLTESTSAGILIYRIIDGEHVHTGKVLRVK